MSKIHDPLFINRGLSWLEFNQRVLDQALDKENPLLERLKFLCIVSSNLDEFFEVRIAGLKQQVQQGSVALAPDGMSPKSELTAILKRVRRQVDDQYRCWNEEIQPALTAHHIRFHSYPDLPKKERAHFEKYFHERILPVLTPLAIDPSHPFPQLLNKSLNIMVHLEGEEINTDLAVVQVPRILPRYVPFGDQTEEQGNDFVLLGSIIKHHVGELFHGVKVLGSHLFRVTRNSNLYVDEEEAENLLHAIEEELRHVNRGAAVRLEVQEDCPEEIADRLLSLFNLEKGDLFRHDGPLNLTRLMPLALSIDRPDLRDKRFTPATVVTLNEEADIFWHIRKGDILLHHPYDSFQTVLDFLGQAAEDPNVLAIKQTLYRTSSDSPLVASLIHAAENGKQVTVVIELKARFDEAANIKWARLMREAGVNVIYGVAGLKTHAKAMLVVRQEGEVIRRYAHLGTGNYHPSTARLYTDLGLLTAREELTADVASMFNILTGVSKFPGMNELLMAPYNLRDGMIELIDREIAHAKAGRPAGMFIKMNALVEQSMIEALCRASQAGVKVNLLVRGICCLRVGVPGMSDTIEVRSLVGRFLEHSRIMRFENGGTPEIYLGSADWMPRNLFRRVETGFPIRNPRIQEHIQEIIDWFWKDNAKSKIMHPDGLYYPMEVTAERFNAQEEFVADSQRRRKAKPVVGATRIND